jgi:hypothetical protein
MPEHRDGAMLKIQPQQSSRNRGAANIGAIEHSDQKHGAFLSIHGERPCAAHRTLTIFVYVFHIGKKAIGESDAVYETGDCRQHIFFPIGSVHAADMATPKTAMPNLPPPMQSDMEWTGFYVGLNGGYGWSQALSISIAEPATDTNLTRSSNMPSGFVGGGQVGYNWQSGHWVFGFEADIQ